MSDLAEYLETRRASVDRALNEFLPGKQVRPSRLHEAMRYSLFAGGKRLRPILALAAAESSGGQAEVALAPACAVECIHTYSLIHDDLPAMDNDDFRRGKPTCHKAFGEGIAILAGDALLTLAFEIVLQANGSSRYPAADLARRLAVASGSRHLIGGQVADLENEGKPVTASELNYIHRSKTAALIGCAISLGAMSANASPQQLEALEEFGLSLGLAFQAVDDILDVTQTSEQLGKSAGKDAAAEKATYVSIYGLDRAREEARKLTRRARQALDPLGKKAQRLHEIADYLLDREF